MTALFQISSFLPLWLLRLVGSLLGYTMWVLSPRYRHLFNQNWLAAMGPQASRRKYSAIAHSGQFVSELPKIWCDPKSVQRMRIEGMDELSPVAREGRGLIILTPHLGAFELAPRAFARHQPITVLYRPARKASVEKLLQAFRPGKNLSTAPANAGGVRQLLRALKRGEAIGMLPDQVPSRGEGLWAEFFGKPAYTMILPIRLAQVTGATLAWALPLRTPDGWILRLERWTPQNLTGSAEELVGAVEQMNRKAEEMILRAPEQYLWAYNRYKNPVSMGLDDPETT
jgi:KDO2-lipid IV(A) lauroyltransferase